MKVAPIGLMNLLAVMDLEASLIYLKGIGVLDYNAELVNRGQGMFASSPEVLKNIVEDDVNPKRAFIIKAMNQLFEEVMRNGITVDLNGKASISDLITQTKMVRKRNEAKLKNYSASADSKLSQQSQASQSSQPLKLENFPQLQQLIEHLSTVHFSTVDFRPATLYLMSKKGSKIAARYGVTFDVQLRKNQHITSGTLGGDFDMHVSPLGPQNLLMIMDLEGACIQLSKQNAIKYSKENENKGLDVGLIHSSMLEEIVEQPDHERREWLVKAINQLIKLTLEEGDII
uniref:Uncharacterized protein n=1 Tax=Panagrolaimus superbus TaxID=310955 RepID=A0A914Z3U1_9BILA